MSSSKRQKKINSLKPNPPPKQDNSDEQFQKDLQELQRLQSMNHDMETMQDFIHFQLQIQEQTLKENYWDLIQLTSYKGLSMARHVAEQHIRTQEGRLEPLVPERQQSRTQPQRQPLTQRQRQIQRGLQIEPQPQNSILLLEFNSQPNQQERQSRQPRNPSLAEPAPARAQRSEQREESERNERHTTLLRIFLGITNPIHQKQPDLFMRLIQDQHLFATVMHEFNCLINNEVFTNLYTYFVLNQEDQGPIRNFELLLFDPRVNTNIANQTIRNLHQDIDIEEILKNVVRVKKSNISQQQKSPELSLNTNVRSENDEENSFSQKNIMRERK